ncbi:MAG: iron(III) transport system ATP-binding protein [Oceanospirillaceae bacterium]|jgi:iron(III) transport system ATP-binding protein
MTIAEQLDTTLLELKNISVGYDDKLIVKTVALQLKLGEIGCLLGPSGCGKSTLLRAIAGFEPVKQGSIELSHSVISQTGITLAPEKRDIGMVFQDVALFPHLSVEKNISFGIQYLSKSEQKKRVSQLLTLVELSGSEKNYPHQLSGGQQQRVALARALAPKPKLILLDEPFSGLDAKLKESLVPQIRAILKHEQVTALIVSHDQAEAFAIADKIAIMNQGEIHQWDSAYNSYHQPATKFAASFIGRSKFLPATTTCEHCIQTSLGNLRSNAPHGYPAGSEVDVLVRIDDVQHAPDSDHCGKVIAKNFHGSYFTYELLLEDAVTVLCSTPAHDMQEYHLNDQFPLKLTIEHLVLFEQ